jgi:hypothetical protein
MWLEKNTKRVVQKAHVWLQPMEIAQTTPWLLHDTESMNNEDTHQAYNLILHFSN